MSIWAARLAVDLVGVLAVAVFFALVGQGGYGWPDPRRWTAQAWVGLFASFVGLQWLAATGFRAAAS